MIPAPVHFDWLDPLVHRDHVAVTFALATGLRIGRGKSLSAHTDLPLLRDASSTPLVPGSSLKGALRASAERLLRGLALAEGASEEGLRRVACDVLDPKSACLGQGPADAADDSDDEPRDRIPRKRAHIARCACLVCATFGGAGLASHLRVPDARIAGATTRVRDGVAIDRDLARVSGSHKYDYEIVEAGAQFTAELVLDNAKLWQLGLLFTALDALDGGGRLGGFGTRGLGVVRVAELDTLRTERRTALQMARRAPPEPGPRLVDGVESLLALTRDRAREVA